MSTVCPMSQATPTSGNANCLADMSLRAEDPALDRETGRAPCSVPAYSK